jgi:hypothetical protein
VRLDAAADRRLGSIHLQGIGRHPAKPAAELTPGDVTVWNYGGTETVVSVAPKGKQSLTVVVSYISQSYPTKGQQVQATRTLRKDRLVAVRPQQES